MRSTVIGFLIAVFVIIFGVTKTIEEHNYLVNLIGIVIVAGGTLSAGVITFGIRDIVNILTITLKVFSRQKPKDDRIISQLIQVSKRLEKNNSYAGLEKDFQNCEPFLKDALRLLENGLSKQKVEEILRSDLQYRVENQMYHVKLLKTLGKYPTAFGMIGTVIGLVALLTKLNADGGSEIIGVSMAVALLTTLYGLFMENYIFNPMADNLLFRLEGDARQRELMIDSILFMMEENDSIILKEKLLVFVRPSERPKILNLLKEI